MIQKENIEMRYDPDEYAKQLVPKYEQGVSYSDRTDYFDQYGNYHFPTDIKLSTPNTATSNTRIPNKSEMLGESNTDYYDSWIMQLQWKQPDGTTKPLVTVEVKDEVQRPENGIYREYQDRPSSR